MNVGEATRQYQAALEQRRSMLEHFGGVLCMEDALAEVDAEVQRATDQLNAAWLEHVCA